MSRMDMIGSPTSVLEIPRFNGQNTAVSFSEIDLTQSPKMLNLLPGKHGSLRKRPGLRPLNKTPLSNPIKRVASIRFSGVNKVVAISNNLLYQFNAGDFTQQTHEVALNSSDIDWAQFKGENGQEVLVITDGGDLKAYDGTKVYQIVPTANDADPLPKNDLTNINTHKPTGCLIHNTRVVLWNGTDTVWHSKIGYYDYFPQVDFQRWVRENDYVQTCVSYRGALVVFMRRHIGVLFGHDRDDWSQDFLDTSDGCLAPKTVSVVTFPDGRQEVFYVSDNGVSAVYAIDTLSLDSSARYSTKSVSNNQIDWRDLGVTKEEWASAVGYFHNGLYWLIYKSGANLKGLVFDTSSEQWFPIDNIQSNDFYNVSDFLYCVDDLGNVMYFDSEITTDYEVYPREAGSPINAYWYSKMMCPKLTGYDHFWDILMVEARQFPTTSTIDVEVNTYRNQFSQPSAIKTAVFIWGETEWGESQWANQKLTDLVNNAKRLNTFVKGQYAQIKLSNSRNEPMEIYGVRYEVRVMDKYS